MCKLNCCSSIREYIKDKDEIVAPSASNLHFRTDYDQKTFIGGLVSFIVSMGVLYTAYARGKQMLQFEDPTLTSINEGINYEDVDKIGIKDVAKPLFEIQEFGDNTIDLDA